MKQEYSAGIIVYFRDENINNEIMIKYLILHYQGGHWDLPKGHIEGQESNQEAAIREAKEETGLDIDLTPGFKKPLSYIFKNQFGEIISKQVYFFVGESHSKEVRLSFEHKGFRWLGIEKAVDLLTFNNAKKLLGEADEFILSRS